MKILILEDDPQRHNFFNAHFGRYNELYITTSVEEAIEIFQRNKPFDVIFLDHDLDGRVYVPSNELNTGFQFAKYLSDQKICGTYVYCHSGSPDGRRAIQEVLPQTVLIPFNYLMVLKLL